MGISTIQSYRGAQIFEAVGLHQAVVDKYFTWTASRIGGVGLDVIAQEVQIRHQHAFPDRPGQRPRPGRRRPLSMARRRRVSSVQSADHPQTATGLPQRRLQGVQGIFAALVNDQSKKACTLRGLLDFKPAPKPIPIEEVESVEAILKRFKTGAMSYGSISKEAHETLAIAMNRIGGKSNTGEGGEDPDRYVLEPNGDSKNSAIKQVASGAFRRDQPLPGQRAGTADQDGAGRQARRRRPIARRQSLSVDRQGAPRHAGRRA